MANYPGTPGNDTYQGGTADDVIEGNDGADVLKGGAGNDRLYDNRQNYFYSDSFADQLFGEAGDDYLELGAGDSGDGGDGNDTIYVKNTPLSVAGGIGSDVLQAAWYADLSTTSISGVERLEGENNSGGTLLAASQFSLFSSVGAYGGGASASFRLSKGGTGTIAFDPTLTSATIYASTQAETLSLKAGTKTALIYYGGTSTGAGTVTGGDGADWLEGGDGADILKGGAGNDRLYDNRANYWYSDSFADQLFGEAGDDYLVLGAGDSGDGGDGNDTIYVIAGTPLSVTGGIGSDVLQVEWQVDLANTAIAGIERLEGQDNNGGPLLAASQFGLFGTVAALGGGTSASFRLSKGGTGTIAFDKVLTSATIYASAEAETLSLKAGTKTALTYYGGTSTGAGTVTGGDGADWLEGGDGADVLKGGAGNDRLYNNNSGYGYSDGFADQLFGEAGDDYLVLGAGDSGDGGDGNDMLVGSTGNEKLTGGAGSDTASYERSNKTVRVDLTKSTAQNTGGGGTDTLSGIENLIGSQADDVLTGDGGDNVLEGLTGNDRLVGGAGNDTASYANGSWPVVVDLRITGPQVDQYMGADTLVSIENLIGSAYDDTLTGNSGANVIEGGAGNDLLDGQGGSDTASYAGAAAAVTVSLALTAQQNTKGAGLDTLKGFENLRGSAFNDKLTGDGAANRLEGGAGNDTLTGGGGVDTLVGGDGNDTYVWDGADSIVEAATTAGGIDTVQSALAQTLGTGVEKLTLTGAAAVNGTGNSLDNTLTGNGAANVLSGLGGNDILIGGAGVDRLDGGLGADTFRFLLASDSDASAPDTIVFFDAPGAGVGDLIDLSGIDANTLTAGNGAFTFGSTATGGLSLVSQGSSTLVRGNTDADAAFEFALLITDGATTHTSYTAADFIL